MTHSDPMPALRIIAAGIAAKEDPIKAAFTLVEMFILSGCKMPTLKDLERLERDQKVYRLRGEGLTPAQVAERCNLSRSQVNRIVAREHRKAMAAARAA